MDTVTFVVTALAVGAAAGLEATVEQTVKDAYAGLKALIQQRYGDVSLASLEKKPESEAKKASVIEDLTEAGASNDQELLDRAKALLDIIRQYDEEKAQETAIAIGVNLKDVEAAYFKLQKATAKGTKATGVLVTDSKFTEGIDIGEVIADSGEDNPK